MNKPKLNKGIFNFLAQQGHNIHDMRKFLLIYAAQHDMHRPKKNRAEWYVTISGIAQADFKGFKKCYNKNKADLPKSYDDWWGECNMDGTFAYNGVTEDF